MIKKEIKFGLLLTGMFLMLSTTVAQVKILKGVRDNIMDENNKNVSLAKYEIDLVMKHPDTKDMCAAWAWKGVVYSEIAMSDNEDVRALDTSSSAALEAGQAFMKFYGCSEDEQGRYDAKEAASIYLMYAIVGCYNAGIAASANKNSFQTVKTYMSIVEGLLKYDVEEKAMSNSVSKEKANYLIWRTAYIDTLIDQEIIYLEKLMSFPKYLNSDIYIRMAEILSAKKEYDKALEYLDKGKLKIPQKTGDFLDMQINIEIDRGNMVNLLTKFNEAIKTNPNSAQYYFSRGVAYHKLKEDEVKNQNQDAKAKYFYSQGLADYQKALDLDPGYYDAIRNEAVILFDSANYIYKMRIYVASSEYDKYDRLSVNLYKQALEKFDRLRESGYLKDADLVDLLKDMKTISIKIGDDELKAKYDAMYKAERKKLND